MWGAPDFTIVLLIKEEAPKLFPSKGKSPEINLFHLHDLTSQGEAAVWKEKQNRVMVKYLTNYLWWELKHVSPESYSKSWCELEALWDRNHACLLPQVCTEPSPALSTESFSVVDCTHVQRCLWTWSSHQIKTLWLRSMVLTKPYSVCSSDISSWEQGNILCNGENYCFPQGLFIL